MSESFSRELNEAAAGSDPIQLFRLWFADARSAQLPEAEAMTLATATLAGAPSARMVLLRGFDEAGFVFFTHFDSRKARELAVNPRAALILYWHPLHRQVRIEGRVETITEEESDAYFRGRQRGSQLGAWASPQSQPIPGREFLDERVRQLTIRFPNDIPRPAFWGGYRVVPNIIEFWQGRENRLHDRLQYCRTSVGWQRLRLAP